MSCRLVFQDLQVELKVREKGVQDIARSAEFKA